MHRYCGTIYGLIGCLILLCGVAGQADAADSCLTQALLEETNVRVVFTDMALDYQMQQGLMPAAIPEGHVNAEGTALAKDFEITLRTLREIILTWPDDALCYPGHGPFFRLGDQRAAIEGFLSKDHGDFFGDATWDM